MRLRHVRWLWHIVVGLYAVYGFLSWLSDRLF